MKDVCPFQEEVGRRKKTIEQYRSEKSKVCNLKKKRLPKMLKWILLGLSIGHIRAKTYFLESTKQHLTKAHGEVWCFIT